MSKYFIIGIEKCATTSLEKDLKLEGHDVIRWEWAYCFPGIREFIKRKYPDYEIIIVTRDPVQRCYSDYHYAIKKKQIPKVSYFNALLIYPRFAQGSAFDKWIPLADIVMSMDEIKSKQNIGSYPPISEHEIKLTQEAIKQAYKTPYFRNYKEIQWFKINVYFNYEDRLMGIIYQTLRKIKKVR